MNKKLGSFLKETEFWVFIIILALSLLIQLRSGLFFTNNNLVDIARSMIYPSMCAICALLAFVSTGPDVSFPLIGALSSYLAIMIANQLNPNLHWSLIYLIGILMGALMGALNGFIIVKYKFPSLIVTLGTSSIFNGILLGTFQAERMDLPASLNQFGKSNLFTVKNNQTGLGSAMPYTLLILIGLYFIAYFILNHTTVGRGIYAIGGDEVAAERAGFNVNKIRFGVFVANGCIAAVAGLSYAVMSLRYLPTEYEGGEMVVIAAIVLGGTRLAGGVGTLRGCLLGTLLLTMVTNSLILVGISIHWQKVIVGLIILLGTAIPQLQKLMLERNQQHENKINVTKN